MLQFAAVVDLADQLRRRGHVSETEGLTVYTQEPRYTAADTVFLESKGVTVLHMTGLDRQDTGPAKTLFGADTFVIEFHVNKDRNMWHELCETDIGCLVADVHEMLGWLIKETDPGHAAFMGWGEMADSGCENSRFYRHMRTQIERRAKRYVLPVDDAGIDDALDRLDVYLRRRKARLEWRCGRCVVS